MLRRELADYPDQRLLSNLVEGVRIEADVELNAVLMPHLESLPLGFASVAKELGRMAAPPLQWYWLNATPPYCTASRRGGAVDADGLVQRLPSPARTKFNLTKPTACC